MKFRKIQTMLLLAAMLLGSCKPILFKIYGIKDPIVENERTIVKKALRYKLDTTNIVTVNSGDFLTVVRQQGIPEGAIYDRRGKYIEYRQTDSSCNAGLFQFIPALSVNGSYKQPERPDLAAELGKFRSLKGEHVTIAENADFYLLLYWATWTGRLNKDHVKIWEDQAHANKNCRIKVIKVNLDVQEYWDEKEREQMLALLKGKK